MSAAAPAVSVVTVPAQGQLVEVRQRRYVVGDVRESALLPDPLAPGDVAPQHLLTLVSVEDDALGEELQVVWEIEPGARVLERSALPAPTAFDDPARFDAFLDAVRWGAAASADVRTLQAPFRSGIAIEDYQLDPVVRAVQMPRANLLVADDVGLGKTIESGLVVQELLLRHRARTVLVVCPSALQIQWRDQMRDKFGLEFRIVDANLLRTLRRERGLHVNPWTHFPRLITSIDFLKRDRPMRLFGETLPAGDEPTYPRKYDVLIVDEAHNVAPSGRGKYATDSLRTAAIRRLAPHFEHKLFLSATPHNGYPESFSALLELLDNQRFARGVSPDRQQLGAIMVRRLKSELPERWDGSPRFPVRRLEAIEVAYTPAEQEAHELLRRYSRSREKGAGDEHERVATEFVLKLLKKRLFSSPEAFARTLEQHERSLVTARARVAAPRPTLGILRRQIEGIDEEFGDDDLADEATAEALTTASRLFREPSPAERELLDRLRDWAEDARRRPDSKTRALLAWLAANLRPNGVWNDERVIVFTEYRDTQRWLGEILAGAGFTRAGRLLTLYGGMRSEERERVKAAFQADPAVSPVRLLLATDAASEGIDLQNHCSRLIHVEIPWNPNRLEQRNGRVDRHGQRASTVDVYHFVGAGWQASRGEAKPDDLASDLEFLWRAAQKVDQIREDLGKVGPVIASQVEEAMLGRRRTLDTSTAERESEPVRRLLRFERRLREQLATLREQLQESKRELRLTPQNVAAVVSIALELAGQPPLREAEVPGLWPDPSGRRRRSPAFHLPALAGSWAAATEGLAHPHTGAIRPIVFDHDLAGGRDDVVLAHLQHRLVQMALRLLRAEVWAPEGQRKLARVTARLVPSDALSDPVLVAHARLLVLGGDHQRLHEELIAAGGALRGGRFVRLNVGELQRALDAAGPEPAPAAVRESLAARWDVYAPALFAALETRSRERGESLGRRLEERAAKEVADSRATLSELRRAILAELHQPAVQQLALFSDPEREQFERNADSLRARAEQIPAEIEREAAAIRARYAAPQTRLFPVAVTFLVPERLAREYGRGS
ncbi:MAG: DEAD/DEAH box helicase family protein [Chloroflexi bacterium]|nr:DEAD/DEAH box helicase family protein [Chloroflexota bacterium]